MRIFLAGHNGMVGQALMRHFAKDGSHDLIVTDRSKLDLTDQAAVKGFLQRERPDAVILAAAKVGGIAANAAFPAQFIYENMMIEANVIHQSFKAGVSRLLFLGSSCIYPRLAKQPIPEEALLDGQLEPTNEPYAVAKIAGLKLCESYNREYGTDYRAVMPTNLYGPCDNFHPQNAHVLPALMQRFHMATETNQKKVTIWGTGRARREFLHVDDMAGACVFVLRLERSAYLSQTSPTRCHLNVGVGRDLTIGDLAEMIAFRTGFSGEIIYDARKPDGAPRKLLDVSRMSQLGWQPQILLKDGIASTYAWFKAQLSNGKLLRAPELVSN